jgi:hypothetical protein
VAANNIPPTYSSKCLERDFSEVQQVGAPGDICWLDKAATLWVCVEGDRPAMWKVTTSCELYATPVAPRRATHYEFQVAARGSVHYSLASSSRGGSASLVSKARSGTVADSTRSPRVWRVVLR